MADHQAPEASGAGPHGPSTGDGGAAQPSATHSVPAGEHADISSYSITLYWDHTFKINTSRGGTQPSFQEGEEVFILLRSEKETGRASIVGKANDGARHTVQYQERTSSEIAEGSFKTYDARTKKIVKVVDKKLRTVIVCYSTQDFRYLCRTQVTDADTVLEIGCSFGKGTHILAEQLGCFRAGEHDGRVRLVALDLGWEPVETAKESLKGAAGVRILHEDVMGGDFSTPTEFLSALYEPKPDGEQEAPLRPSLVFVDIGGNRAAEAVLELIPVVAAVLRPRQIILKNEQIFDILEAERVRDHAAGAREGVAFQTFESDVFRGGGRGGGDAGSGRRHPLSSVDKKKSLQE